MLPSSLNQPCTYIRGCVSFFLGFEYNCVYSEPFSFVNFAFCRSLQSMAHFMAGFLSLRMCKWHSMTRGGCVVDVFFFSSVF